MAALSCWTVVLVQRGRVKDSSICIWSVFSVYGVFVPSTSSSSWCSCRAHQLAAIDPFNFPAIICQKLSTHAHDANKHCVVLCTKIQVQSLTVNLPPIYCNRISPSFWFWTVSCYAFTVFAKWKSNGAIFKNLLFILSRSHLLIVCVRGSQTFYDDSWLHTAIFGDVLDA